MNSKIFLLSSFLASFVIQCLCAENSQIISFPAIPNQTTFSAPIQLQATATSALPVTYTITQGEDTATLEGAWLELTNLTGTVTVEATQAGDATYDPATPVSRTFTVSTSPGAPIRMTNTGGVWTWFNDERAIISNGKLIAGYMDNVGKSGISSFDMATQAMEFYTLSTWTEKDDHNNAGLCVLPDGRILAMYARHHKVSNYNYRISTNPGDISAWSQEYTHGPLIDNITYANPYLLTAEGNRIYNYFRGEGFDTNVTWSDDNGLTWATPVRIFDTPGRPYIKLASNGIDRIDIAFTSQHPSTGPTDLHHMYYQGGNLYKTDGTLIKSMTDLATAPIVPWDAQMVYDLDGPGSVGRPWIWDNGYDSSGNPVMVFSVNYGSSTSVEGSGLDIRYFYAKWNPVGSSWNFHQVAYGGERLYEVENYYAGGISLDPDNTDIVYFSTKDDPQTGVLSSSGIYEIYKGVTSDDGATWTITPVTQNSTQDNLRPFVPVGHGSDPCILWFKGDYPTFKAYRTEIYASFSDTVNLPPSFTWNSPRSRTLFLPQEDNELTLDISMSDDGPESNLTCRWEMVYGPAELVFSDADEALTRVSFPVPGDYRIRAIVSDGFMDTWEDVIVTAGGSQVPEPAPANLSLHLQFDGSSPTSAMDSSGLGNHGTISGLTRVSEAVLNGGVELDGNDDYVTVSDNSSIDPSSAFTIALWIKADNLHTGGLVSKRVGINTENAFTTYLDDEGQIAVDVDGSNNRFFSNSRIDPGKWYHVAIVYDGTLPEEERTRLYIDGNLDIVASESSSTIPNSSAPILVGSPTASHSADFEGQFDDVRFYTRPLNEMEVAYLSMQANIAVEVSANSSEPNIEVGENVTLSGTPGTTSVVLYDDFETEPPVWWTHLQLSQVIAEAAYTGSKGLRASVDTTEADGQLFMRNFSPQTLNQGDSLTLTWRARVSAFTSSTQSLFRFGLYNSNGIQLTKNSSYVSPTLSNYTGYSLFTFARQNSNNGNTALLNILSRENASNTLIASSAHGSSLDSSSNGMETMGNNSWTPLQSLKLTRTSTGYQVETELGGIDGDSNFPANATTLTFSDPSAIETFDTLAFWFKVDSSGRTIDLDDVTLTYHNSVQQASYTSQWSIPENESAVAFEHADRNVTDSIASLPGQWDVYYTVIDDLASISSSVRLKVNDQYSNWAFRESLTHLNDAEDHDPEGDNIINILEYAFNLKPLEVDGHALSTATSGLPTSQVVYDSGIPYLEMTYLKDTLKSDLVLTPQFNTTDLGINSWNPISDLLLVESQGTVEKWRARIPIDEDQGFMKLCIERTP